LGLRTSAPHSLPLEHRHQELSPAHDVTKHERARGIDVPYADRIEDYRVVLHRVLQLAVDAGVESIGELFRELA
jgi:hypothetical protein